MADPINQILKPSVNSELSIDALISAPLIAASRANAEMVLGQTSFLLRNCFTKNDQNKYEPIMISMTMTKSFINTDKAPTDPEYFKLEKITFQVPLLSIIPLNSLAIDKINLGFEMEITSSSNWIYTDEDKKTANRVLEKKTQLNGKLSSDSSHQTKNDIQYKKSNASKLKVEITAGSLPLPLGVLSILEFYTKNINPILSDDKNTKP